MFFGICLFSGLTFFKIIFGLILILFGFSMALPSAEEQNSVNSKVYYGKMFVNGYYAVLLPLSIWAVLDTLSKFFNKD